MIDASKFPRVPVVPVADVGQPPPGRSESAAVEREQTKLGAAGSAQSAGLAPKTMALREGRYYVVSEEK
ncbi:hypothetical protein IFT43_14975 [Oxalobacteraceae sp. CFBP 13708]|nr:hypothetical protein [Oxalobacteraceae sp. CFBP 13708]